MRWIYMYCYIYNVGKVYYNSLIMSIDHDNDHNKSLNYSAWSADCRNERQPVFATRNRNPGIFLALAS